MKKIILFFTICICALANAQNIDSLHYNIDDVVISHIYRVPVNAGGEVSRDDIINSNYGQDPSLTFSKMPSIVALNDNGTEFGYGYFRIRGLDQTRINVTLDGCPWNEAEDFGLYFVNSPDLMSSMNSIKVERGASSLYNGIAGSAGGVLLESIDLYSNYNSYINFSAGSYNSYRGSFVYNLPTEDGWGLHIKMTTQETDGYRVNSDNNSKALTIKTGYKFNNNHQLDILSMNGYHRNHQGWIGNTVDELYINSKANGCSQAETDNWFMSMNRLQYKGRIHEKIVLTSSIYGQFQTGGYRFDLDNYMNKFFGDNTQTDKIYDYNLKHYMIGSNTAAIFYINNFKLTAGLNYYVYNRRHYLGNKAVNMDNDDYYDNSGTKHDIQSQFIGVYNVTKNFNIYGNVQYRGVNFNYNDNVTDDYFHLASWNFLNYGFGAEYNFNKNKLYARFSHVNREPTRSDMFGGNEWYSGELVTKTAEISNDVEVGIDFNHNDKFNFNINLYYMWFDNELVLNGEYGTNGLPCHENANDSYRMGIEAVIDWNIYKHLDLKMNGSIAENTIKTTSFGTKRHILTPRYTGNIDIVWDDYTWSIGMNFNIHDKMYIDSNNDYEIPMAYTLNAYGSIRISDFEVSILLNNLTNKVNYNNGMVGYNEPLYIRNAGFNFNIGLKYFF